MIIDASSILAIVLEEDEGPSFTDRILDCEEPMTISPVNVWEIAARINKLGDPAPLGRTERLLDHYGIDIAVIDRTQLEHAIDAQARFGKGNHGARLNMGDCFAYALAKSRGEPLLYKGDDFPRTDIEPVA